jgi:hypothetical protein
MVRVSRYFIPFIFFFLCCKQEQKFEKWKIISTSILLTSDPEDKEDLYKRCKGKDILISKDSLFFNNDCLFEQQIKGELTSYKKTTYHSLCSYFNNDKLKALLAIKGKISKYYFLNTVKFKLTDGSIDSCSLILNELKSRMFIFYDPYVLTLEPATAVR